MRIRRGAVYPLILAVLTCVAIWLSARQLLPARPPPEPGLEDWLDVWATYDLEVIPTRPKPHIVQPGETIWDVARAYRLPGDLRMTVDIIRELNSLWGPDGPRLKPGQRLKVPEPDREQWPLAMQQAWQ